MIVITNYQDNLELGKNYVNREVADMHQVPQTISFVVIKKATKEEYMKQCKEYGYTEADIDWNQAQYFWWVLMD